MELSDYVKEISGIFCKYKDIQSIDIKVPISIGFPNEGIIIDQSDREPIYTIAF